MVFVKERKQRRLEFLPLVPLFSMVAKVQGEYVHIDSTAPLPVTQTQTVMRNYFSKTAVPALMISRHQVKQKRNRSVNTSPHNLDLVI